MTAQIDTATRQTLRNAIFTICGSQNPKRADLDRIGREAAQLVHKSRPWSGSWLYTLMHLDRYNNGHVKYGISPKLLNAVMQLAKREALNGKKPITLYAENRVREGSIVFGHSRKCARRRCGIWFVSDSSRLYCSDICKRRVERHRRKLAAERRRQAELLRRRKGQTR